MAWEYQILSMQSSMRGQPFDLSALNDLGQQGWEAVGVTPLYSTVWAVLLKRHTDERL